MIIGAHPDDCEVNCGGTVAKWAGRGDRIQIVSITNGDKGHFTQSFMDDPSALAACRKREALAAAALIGAEYVCLGLHDGEVTVTAELTQQLVRLIRRAQPDLVVTCRPCDYHRDHRYGTQAVLDAMWMLVIPMYCPDTPALPRLPVSVYWADRFTESGAFRQDVIVGIDEALETKAAMLAAHESQIFEGIPYFAGVHDQVPLDPAGRQQWIRRFMLERYDRVRNRCQPLGNTVFSDPLDEWREAFQIGEYGRQPSREELRSLFPIDN